MEKKPKPNKFGITLKLHQINKIKELIKNDDELKTQIEEAKKEREMRNELELQQTQKNKTNTIEQHQESKEEFEKYNSFENDIDSVINQEQESFLSFF